MTTADFIVAIELGSSKITGIAGRKNSDGGIQILAYAKENSSVFIRKGVIYNLDKTAQSLTSIINKLEAELDSTIGKVYVGIGGQSLRTVGNTVTRHLDDETIISQELIDDIINENIQIPIIDMEILEVSPQEYRIGNNLQTDPVGVLSNHVEGRFLNIIARSSLKKNIIKCFEQAKIDIAGFLISPLVMADATLSDSEKRSGCALIDFGADTTTVSIYQKNILRHLTVIPLGGNSITHDICRQQMEEEEAEELKTKYGCAVYEPQEEEENNTYPIDDKRTIEAKTLNNIIEARTEEIVANVWNQITLSGYDDKLLAGIIITGGASNLKGLDEAIHKRIKLEKGKTDKIRAAKYVHHSIKGTISDVMSRDSSLNTILGLLYAGESNCYKPEEIKPATEEWKEGSTTLFGEDIYDDADIRERKEREKEKEEKERREKAKKDKERQEKEKKEKERKDKGPSKIGKWINDVTNTIFSDDEMK